MLQLLSRANLKTKFRFLMFTTLIIIILTGVASTYFAEIGLDKLKMRIYTTQMQYNSVAFLVEYMSNMVIFR